MVGSGFCGTTSKPTIKPAKGIRIYSTVHVFVPCFSCFFIQIFSPLSRETVMFFLVCLRDIGYLHILGNRLPENAKKRIFTVEETV